MDEIVQVVIEHIRSSLSKYVQQRGETGPTKVSTERELVLYQNFLYGVCVLAELLDSHTASVVGEDFAVDGKILRGDVPADVQACGFLWFSADAENAPSMTEDEHAAWKGFLGALRRGEITGDDVDAFQLLVYDALSTILPAEDNYFEAASSTGNLPADAAERVGRLFSQQQPVVRPPTPPQGRGAGSSGAKGRGGGRRRRPRTYRRPTTAADKPRPIKPATDPAIA